MPVLHAGNYHFDLTRPLIMGVINPTPDSFSDGGRFATADMAIEYALNLRAQGADILDVGGESTRPGALPVNEQDEWQRIKPIMNALVKKDIPVSVDTRKPSVMKAAIEAGAAMINDVQALRAPGALEVVAASSAAVCLMHMSGTPQTMQDHPAYENVVEEVESFLADRVEACEKAGIGRDRLVIDPGFGFGKSLEHNLDLLGQLGVFQKLNVPVLVGMSRKSMLGALTGRPVDQREYAGIAAHLLAIARGARILRVHDVAAMKDALCVWNAVKGEG
jgi:dihydropteroate synthase